MAWTYVGAAYNQNDAGGSTLDCSGTLDLVEGDLLVGVCRYYLSGDIYTQTLAVNDGTEAFTMLTQVAPAGSPARLMRIGYRIVAATNDDATLRQTISNSATYRALVVLQFRPDTGDTVELDASDAGQTADSGTTLTSATISTVGDDEVVVGCGDCSSSQTYSNPLVAGGAATGSQDSSASSYATAWYKIFTSPQTNITAQRTQGSSDSWACGILAFKSTGTGGSNIPIVVALERRRRG